MSVEEKTKTAIIEYPENTVLIQQNSLKGTISPENIELRTEAILEPYKAYKTDDPLIACLINAESDGNPYAVGDSGLAYGILQFHFATFNYYENYYGLDLNYYSPQDQITLAKIMLKNNLGYHWSTYNICN